MPNNLNIRKMGGFSIYLPINSKKVTSGMIAVLTGFVYVHFTMSYMKKKQYVLKWALSTSVCLYFARAESIVGEKLFVPQRG